MDPNATLARIRELLDEWREGGNEWQEWEEADELAQLVKDLDGWLSKGGFLPETWQAKHADDMIRRMRDA